jgi:hypothetical protein
MKKLIVIALCLLIGYLALVNPQSSHIMFSRQPLLVKALDLTQYLVVATVKILWQAVPEAVSILRFFGGLLFDVWSRYVGDNAPSYDIRSHQELYLLYTEVEAWSGLPWQIFWGLHAEETSLGRNLGATRIINVLPSGQKTYFSQMCQELRWDPDQVYGSHKGAIGPFQFIPETWVRHAIDGNGDGVKDPFNLEDAVYSAANYLLYKGAQNDLQKAIWHYNQDPRYVKRVMRYLKYS